MKLRDLIATAGLETPASVDSTEVTDLAYRSQNVAPGALFFCVRGERVDGHEYASDAVERGAVALCCQRRLDAAVPQIVVDDVRAAMAPIASAFFGHPSERMRLVGVTGTNGKTTTTFLIHHILEQSGIRSGLLGTVQSVVAGRSGPVERTTPEATDLQRALREMVDGGDKACVMEVSSHALELHRVDATAFDCAVFTNLSQDHLDFHGTLDRYFGAKRSLFVPLDAGRPTTSVINLDDEWGRRLAAEVAEVGQTGLVTFAVENDADVRADDVVASGEGSRFDCLVGEERHTVTLPLPGLFNVYNAIAAIAACTTIGVSVDTSVAALATSPRVPGRMEAVDAGQPFSVLVDYAHTPDSVESMLRAGRELLEASGGRGHLICVLGAGGDRDRDKRPLMGEAVAMLADLAVVTSDNPRSEDPQAIIADVLRGASPEAGIAEIEVEPDRAKAIELAVTRARRGDMVLIAGKGHEQGQEFAEGHTLPFDDREVAHAALSALAPSGGWR